MTMTLPTYAQALTVPTVTAEEAALLAQFSGSTLAGWPDGAPQRDLVKGEAMALQWEMLQRAAVAFAASPSRVLQLAAFQVTQGYSATDAAAIQSSWVDVVLEIYQLPNGSGGIGRIPATFAQWSVPLTSSLSPQAPFTVDTTSTITLQANDGTIFQAAQTTPLTANAGNSYRIAPTFNARVAGTSGNVIPGTIAKIISAPNGIAIDATRTQVLTTVARDQEGDADAIARGLARWGTLSGVLTAAGWQYVLLTGVTSLTRVFVDDANPLGPGSVGLALINSAGAALPSEVAAAQAIASGLRIAGMGPVGVAAATQLTVPVSASLKTTGANPSLAAAQAASVLAKLGPAVTGDFLYLDAVIAALMAVPTVINIPQLSLTADIRRPTSGVIVLQPTVTAS
ncbi:MAG TPA: baseplate J/gp47 family protein [Polyangia bacterium]